MTVDKLLMPTASSVDFARARPSTICREEEEERARRGALSTAQFSNTVIVGSYLMWFYPRKIESGLVIHKIHAKSGGTKLSDCKVEVKNFQKNLYISQHLGINCYVNFLGHLGCDGFQLKWMFGTHGNWQNQNPGGSFWSYQLNSTPQRASREETRESLAHLTCTLRSDLKGTL